MRARQRKIFGFFLLLTLPALPLLAQSARKPAAGPHTGDFFIISSVDTAKKQLLLKLPTEVTEVMRVDEKTVYLDKDGKAIKLAELRAGDTVYIISRKSDGGPTAVSVRKGPMTLDELRRRYL